MLQDESENSRWRAAYLAGGAVIGGLVGLATAYLMIRSSEERSGGPPQLTTADAIRIGVSTVGLIRGITALGDNPPAGRK
jgi:hypothetical protein